MKLAALDIGLKRIGLALCFDEKTTIPQTPIQRKNRNQAALQTQIFLKEWDIEKLIVGIPKDSDTSGEMQRRIEHFVSLLELEIPIVYQDEQNSSNEAKEMSAGVFRHSKDGKIDSLAAALILERYLAKQG